MQPETLAMQHSNMPKRGHDDVNMTAQQTGNLPNTTKKMHRRRPTIVPGTLTTTLLQKN
jgi:hypothetical protein